MVRSAKHDSDKAPKPSDKAKPEGGKGRGKGKPQDDIVDQAGKESFPASDSPSWNP